MKWIVEADGFKQEYSNKKTAMKVRAELRRISPRGNCIDLYGIKGKEAIWKKR